MLTFAALYEKYANDVYRFAFWLSGNGLEADDLTSETFVRVWSSNRPIRTATVKAYLFTITRNLFLEQIRKDKRLVTLETTQRDTASSPAEIAEWRDELTQVREAMQQLSEIDRSALILHAYHQIPYSEIARILDISLSAAKVKVHRARLKLALWTEKTDE